MRALAAVLLAILSFLLLGASGAMQALPDDRGPWIGACLALMFWSGCVAGSLLTDQKRG
jgi:hypothetical protein